jgi:hypothetical protein
MVTAGRSSLFDDPPHPAAPTAATARATGRLDLKRMGGQSDARRPPGVVLEEDLQSFARTIVRICARLAPLIRLATTPARTA